MILVPIIALLLGAILALGLKVRVGDSMAQYLAVACLAGLDTVLGGMRSAYESKFQTDVLEWILCKCSHRVLYRLAW